jgi:hypothetical protein
MNIAIFFFGLLVSTCVTIFAVLTRSEFKKMEAHPELYEKPLRAYFGVEKYEDAKR